MRYSFIFFAILVLFAFGCKKNKQNKLIGDWELLPQYATDTIQNVVYTFDAANTLYRSNDVYGLDTAEYTLVKEFTKFYVDIQNLDQYTDGHYYIEELDEKILILQCYNPFLRKEFTRKK